MTDDNSLIIHVKGNDAEIEMKPTNNLIMINFKMFNLVAEYTDAHCAALAWNASQDSYTVQNPSISLNSENLIGINIKL